MAIWLPLIVAILSIAGAYWNSVRTNAQKAKIEFVNDQLKLLYGPLYSLSQASSAAWSEFRTVYRPGGAFFNETNPPSADELIEWRRWMRTVFGPMNEKMAKTIIEHADLIEGKAMPHSFLELISHVEGYRVTFEKWSNNDFSQHTSLINFPSGFQKDVENAFKTLKARQTELLGGR